MKILLLLAILFVLPVYAMSKPAEATPLTSAEITTLTSLQCESINVYDVKNQMVFGNPHSHVNTSKQLYLVKNITNHLLSIDFPAGHTGASAWITQWIKPQEWTAYLYVPGQDVLRTDAGKQETLWRCNAFNNNYQQIDAKNESYCQRYLYVCKITPHANVAETTTQKSANYLLQHATKSWWAIIPNSSANSTKDIKQLLQEWAKKLDFST